MGRNTMEILVLAALLSMAGAQYNYQRDNGERLSSYSDSGGLRKNPAFRALINIKPGEWYSVDKTKDAFDFKTHDSAEEEESEDLVREEVVELVDVEETPNGQKILKEEQTSVGRRYEAPEEEDGVKKNPLFRALARIKPGEWHQLDRPSDTDLFVRKENDLSRRWDALLKSGQASRTLEGAK